MTPVIDDYVKFHLWSGSLAPSTPKARRSALQVYNGIDELKAAQSVELGPTEWFEIEQSRIDQFADTTEDRQWIHVDAARAADGPFGATVAHGFLTLSLLPFFSNSLRRIEGMTMGINYGLNKVRFPSPVIVGSRVRGRLTMIELEDVSGGALQTVSRVTIDIEGGTKPACVADMVARYYFA
jgi:acyl dehydratase